MELVETIPAVLKNYHKKMTVEHKTIYQVIYKVFKKIFTKDGFKGNDSLIS